MAHARLTLLITRTKKTSAIPERDNPVPSSQIRSQEPEDKHVVGCVLPPLMRAFGFAAAGAVAVAGMAHGMGPARDRRLSKCPSLL